MKRTDDNQRQNLIEARDLWAKLQRWNPTDAGTSRLGHLCPDSEEDLDGLLFLRRPTTAKSAYLLSTFGFEVSTRPISRTGRRSELWVPF